MIITRDEKRELLRTRDRVAAEVFEVLHLVLREVPALVSYRCEILVDGSRGFLLFVEAANIYFISFFWYSWQARQRTSAFQVRSLFLFLGGLPN